MQGVTWRISSQTRHGRTGKQSCIISLPFPPPANMTQEGMLLLTITMPCKPPFLPPFCSCLDLPLVEPGKNNYDQTGLEKQWKIIERVAGLPPSIHSNSILETRWCENQKHPYCWTRTWVKVQSIQVTHCNGVSVMLGCYFVFEAV